MLINTVIAGISTFWCTTFTLPKCVIKQINQMCGAYLWKGTLEGNHSARLAWMEITHCKDEGGLGVRELVTCNKAFALKLIWMLFFSLGFIWVAWFIKEILSGSVSNFWTLKQKHSWMVNRLLRLRSVAFPWIKKVIGNGKTCQFWMDN